MVPPVKGGSVDLGAQKVDDLFGGRQHFGRLGQPPAHLVQAAFHAPVIFLAADSNAEAAQQALVFHQVQRQVLGLILFAQEIPDLGQLLLGGRGHITQRGAELCGTLRAPLLIGVHQLVQCLHAVRFQLGKQLLQFAVTGS